MEKPTDQDLRKLSARDGDTVYTDESKMPFGKYKDQEMYSIPDNYFRWLIDQDWIQDKWPGLYEYCEERI